MANAFISSGLSAGVGNVLPSLATITTKSSPLHTVLDLVLRDCALIMESSNLLFSNRPMQMLIPLPVIGFLFEAPEEIVFAKYSYAEYPLLNRATVANSFVKDVCPLRIGALRPITKGNNVVTNYLMNQVLIRKYIERYADRGGLFAINTGWGYIGNLALEEFKGKKVNNSNMSGVGFEFTFKRLNFAEIGLAQKVMSSMIGGV